MMSKKVIVLGASANPERASNKAVEMLLEEGYIPVPVNPGGGEVHGVETVTSLSGISGDIDTLSLYVNPEISSGIADEIIALKPRRVLFSPGAENTELNQRCVENGIETMNACTLVLLKTGQF